MPDFDALFPQLYGRPPAGVASSELDAAETRLGASLPDALRAFYEACGREPAVTSSHNRFRPPQQLERADGRVLFCEENQGVCYWGFTPGAVDPVAEVGNLLRDGALEWHSEEIALGQFLEVLVYLQSAWGGFEYTGDLQDPTPVMSKIEAEWDVVAHHQDMTIYGRPGALISRLDGDEFLIGSARTEEHFATLLSELGFNPL